MTSLTNASALKDYTVKHPVYFTKTDPPYADAETRELTQTGIAKLHGHGWWWMFRAPTQESYLYFCYATEGDTAWRRVYVQDTAPASANQGTYWYNWKQTKLYRRKSTNWVQLTSDDEEKVVTAFGTV